MRVSLALLSVSFVGMVGGAWLIGVWCVGLAVVVWSALLGVFALLRDDTPTKQVETPASSEEEAFRRRVVAAQAKRAS